MSHSDLTLALINLMAKMTDTERSDFLHTLNSTRQPNVEVEKVPCCLDEPACCDCNECADSACSICKSSVEEAPCLVQHAEPEKTPCLVQPAESAKIVCPTECVCCPCCKCDCALAAASVDSKISTDTVKSTIRKLITLLEVPRDVPVVQAPEYTRKILGQEKIWPILTMFAIEGVSVLQEMYANSDSREYARDILRELVYQICRNASGFLMRRRRIVDSTRCAMPPLLKQLHNSCFIVGEKSLLATAIELGDLQDIKLILQCQGLHAAL